ncbi:MAG: radical SAM protein, partial [Candidatus Lokiarchaeota archaeon]|nr:radical SAM protein [Candidatus Lokiarchaeota archaeon]
MIDILFINPRTEINYNEDSDEDEDPIYHVNDPHSHESLREPPNGLLILSAIMQKLGYSTELMDCSLLVNPYDMIRKKHDQYRLIGITALTNTINYAMQLAKTAKRYNPKAFIILGGPHASFTYEELLHQYPFIDCICIGEAEQTFPWLTKTILQVPSIDSVYDNNIDIDNTSNTFGKFQNIMSKLEKIPKGLAYLSSPIKNSFLLDVYRWIKGFGTKRDDVTWQIDEKKSREKDITYTGFPDATDLSKLPLPNRETISMQYSVADVLINRGCPNNCSFCSRTKLFPKMRIRSIDSVFKELNQILSHSNYRFVNFYDNININIDHFDKFLERLHEENFPLPWGAELRADYITSKQARLMKETKCQIVATGIESADKEVLKQNFKMQDPQKVATGIKILKREGIAIQAYFMIGLPGDTKE